jgi:hypothetical protein|tara:strand:- start:6224 stop:6394 length:171 start_codon:yes stop_codon:yes gene_type:complete
VNDKVVHKASIEILWHFNCGACSNWWSYATIEGYEPTKMKCPHCGQEGEIAVEDSR